MPTAGGSIGRRFGRGREEGLDAVVAADDGVQEVPRRQPPNHYENENRRTRRWHVPVGVSRGEDFAAEADVSEELGQVENAYQGAHGEFPVGPGAFDKDEDEDV